MTDPQGPEKHREEASRVLTWIHGACSEYGPCDTAWHHRLVDDFTTALASAIRALASEPHEA